MSAPERIGGPAKGEGHGGAARGYSWQPFEVGNDVAVKHGSYAVLQLRPRAEEITGRLVDAMGDGWDEKYRAAVEAASLAGARVERAMGVLLDEADTEQLARLDQDARGWLRLYLQTLERLGLTPQVGNDGAVGAVNFVVVSSFPGVRRADIELAAKESPAIEAGGGS